ncbi:MAG: transcription-repair coupling factor [Thermodesulfobacteriota bacterium]
MITDTHYLTDLKKSIAQGGLVDVTGLKGSSLAFALAETENTLSGPIICVTPGLKEAELYATEFAFFCKRPVFVFPSYEVFPFRELSPHKTTVSRRIETLYRMVSSDPNFIVVVPVEALLQKLLPKKVLTDFVDYIVTHEDLDRQTLREKLIAGGYTATSLVQEVGDFSIRGGIIDLFPPMHTDPIRIDCLGDWVESIREFDRLTQRSIREISEITLLPVHEVILREQETAYALKHIRQYAMERDIALDGIKEIEAQIEQHIHFAGSEFLLPLFYPELSTWRDYLPAAVLLVSIDPMRIEEEQAHFRNKVKEINTSARADSRFCPEPQDLYQIDHNWAGLIPAASHVRIISLPIEEELVAGKHLHLATLGNENIRSEFLVGHEGEDFFTALPHRIIAWLDEGESIYLVCRTIHTAEQVKRLLTDYHIQAEVLNTPFLFALESSNQRVRIHTGDISRGFRFPAYRLILLTESELFGEKIKKPAAAIKKKFPPLLNFSELKPDDLIVHRDHGIGLYRNLVRLEVNSTVNDYLLLEYRDGDKLYLPVYRLNVLQKYIGVEGYTPQLNKLGGKSWQLARKRVKEAIWKVALELLDIYARRKVEKGFAFSPPHSLYKEFELSFEHEETPDQIAAIEDTIGDMASSRPMDRLICGDVGYGKTEVALRAAFKAVMDGKQVAVLVPTTVLAEQHFQTFSRRLSPFPVVVACLSRFRTAREQKQILSKLAEGKVDIVIGTHRLLQKDINFHDPGLLIIDEEHRFGVRHKEQLKKMKKTVDVLTLTATPIPRTLQMSLLSVRDLSVISTPPQDRIPVKTYVTRFDDNVIREAIIREYQRGGQVFFVHNRVAGIEAVAERLRRLVPEVRIAVAHGQLSSRALEEIMVRFVRREIDVLVCTTIIESGLDIPSANTIIISRADRLGLAEIYQLRGRVGRSKEQAYAYLLVPSPAHLTRDAQKRLEALLDLSELGSSFKLAMSDLQIRGAGNILGTSQTGHIAVVGYDLYLDLLEKTVNELKGTPAEEEFEPEINLKVSAYIPEDYLPEPDQRLITYRRLTTADTVTALSDIKDELTDRYGPIPPEVKNLMSIMEIKQDLKKLKVHRLDTTNGHFILSFSDRTSLSPETILSLIRRNQGKYRFTPENRLYAALPGDEEVLILEEVKKVLQALL